MVYPEGLNVRGHRTWAPVCSLCCRSLATLATVACSAAIAACGSSGNSIGAASGGPSLAHAGAGLKFANCMRSHGVPSFPDPSGGGGINLDGTGVNPQSPAFKSAQQACFRLLPGGGPGAQHPTAQEMAQTLKISQCMRRRGVSGFPDPTLTPPSNPNPSDHSLVEDRGGVVLAVPSTINPGSPVFRQAAAACGFQKPCGAPSTPAAPRLGGGEVCAPIVV